jgi:hypothetical protein
MSKWIVDTVELIKRQYVIDAYTKDEAIGKMEEQAPHNVEVLSNTIYDIRTVNEYEYNLDWIDKASGRDREGNGK